MVRKFTKSKAVFPTDDSIRKVIYMSVVEISKKWTMPIRDWGLAYSQFAIFFEDRFAAWRLTRALPTCSRGLSASGISGEKWKGSNISAAVLHRFIPQPVSGRSSALPCSAAFLVLSEFWVLNAFTQFIFHNHWKQSKLPEERKRSPQSCNSTVTKAFNTHLIRILSWFNHTTLFRQCQDAGILMIMLWLKISFLSLKRSVYIGWSWRLMRRLASS